MTGQLLAAAGWIGSVGGAIVLIFAAIRSFLQWPTTEAVVSGEECTVFIVNDGPTHIHVVGFSTLWPRDIRFGIQKIGQPDPKEPWKPGPDLPVEWTSYLRVSEVVKPGERAEVRFLLSTPRDLSNATVIIMAMRSARFVARRSWKPVKTLQMATPTKITA
jgi:hypothetical protein